MSKPHLLELFQEGFWRRAAVKSLTLPALSTRHALAVPMNATPIFEGKAAIVPWPEPPWLIEPKEQPGMMVPVAEVTMLERHMTEPEHDIAVAELQHQPLLSKVPEVPRLEVRVMSEPECETTLVEVPDVPRLERPGLPDERTVVELEAPVMQVQLWHGVPRKMPKTEAAVTCLCWLRHDLQRRHYSCEHHHFAHRVAP